MTDDRFSLDGRVAVVTGGGTGIGRATARVLAAHGADVVLAARRVELLERTAGEVEALGRRALVVPTDVTDPAQCEALVATTVRGLGRIDVLVNNAGGTVTKPPASGRSPSGTRSSTSTSRASGSAPGPPPPT